MNPPIFVFDADGELTVFLSRRRAEAYFEVNDLEDSEHVFYDGEGRQLLADPNPARNAVLLKDGSPEHQGELRDHLRVSLARLGVSAQEVQGLELDGLVRLASKYAIDK